MKLQTKATSSSHKRTCPGQGSKEPHRCSKTMSHTESLSLSRMHKKSGFAQLLWNGGPWHRWWLCSTWTPHTGPLPRSPMGMEVLLRTGHDYLQPAWGPESLPQSLQWDRHTNTALPVPQPNAQWPCITITMTLCCCFLGGFLSLFFFFFFY